jgi:acetoacetate decarboxylase
MGFVKTPEEVARIEKVTSRPRFVGSEMLTIDFLTTPEFVTSVLPPSLEPASEPLVTAMVGRWRSNCVGDYARGAIYLMARHQMIEAPYVLAIYMDADYAIMFGRDFFGELTLAEFDNALSVRKEEPGSLRLASSIHVPLDDIPVVALRQSQLH